MNETIETILNHRSIRSFTNEPLTKEQIKTIVESAQMASTSTYIQAYTIIGVNNLVTKQKIMKISANQPYIVENGHFFIFCADLNRHVIAGKMEDVDVQASLESTEKFMVSLIDASLAAQNAALAAESMGLGICYIGSIRNGMDEVTELLKLPPFVIPLFGLAVGYPAKITDQKPRLPFENVYHEEVYQQDEEKFIKQLDEYNKIISAYYEGRTKGKRKDRWTEQVANLLKEPKRMDMKNYLESQGFLKS